MCHKKLFRLLFRICFISSHLWHSCADPRDSRMKNARPRFPAIRIAMVRTSRRQISFWCWCSKGSLAFQEEPACNPFFFFFLLLSPLLPWVTSVSNVGPLEMGYFIHLEYKAKVSPADHMPSLHACTHVRTHAVPSVHPRTLAMQQRLTYGISLSMYTRMCMNVSAYVNAYVYETTSNLT